MFYKGDKVICVRKNEWVPAGTVGTVLENSDVPFVRWENGETWALRSADMKNYDDTDKTKEIEVGDRVELITDKYQDPWELPWGTRGTVMAIRPYGTYTIRFDNWHKGHDGDISDIKDSSCLFIIKEAVELVAKGEPKQKEEPKYNIVLYRQGNKVIAKLTEGKKVINIAEAKCSPDDKFNFFIGSQIALQRLMAGQVKDHEDIVYPVPAFTEMEDFLLY